MAKTFNYPLFLSLQEQACLLVGFGKVGQRKLATLLEASPARILILDRMPLADLDRRQKALLQNTVCHYETRAWSPEDIAEAFLVFACSSDFEENAKISRECARRGKLCNNVTTPEEGNFLVPASCNKGEISVAVATNGASPILAATLRDAISSEVERFARFSIFLKIARKHVLSLAAGSNENRVFFSQLCSPRLMELFQANDYPGVIAWIKDNLSGQQRKIALQAFEEMGQ